MERHPFRLTAFATVAAVAPAATPSRYGSTVAAQFTAHRAVEQKLRRDTLKGTARECGDSSTTLGMT